MKLSMSMIARLLGEMGLEMKLSLVDDLRTVKGVRYLFDQRIEFSPSYAYVGRGDGFLTDPGFAGHCVIVSGNNYIACRGCSIEELFDDLLDVFERYDAWESALESAASACASVVEIVDVAAHLVGSPMAVTDIAGTVIASAHIDKLDEGTLLSRIVSAGGLSHELMAQRFVDEDGHPVSDLVSTLQVLSPVASPDDIAVACYLNACDENLGTFTVQTTAKDKGFDRLAAEFVAPYILRASEFTMGGSGLRPNRSILADLIEGVSVGEADLEKLAASVGEGPLQVVVVESRETNSPTHRNNIAAALSACIGSCYATVYDGRVVALMPLLGREATAREVRSAVRMSYAAGGVSMSMSDVRNARSAYRQALFAIGQEVSPGLRFCQDLALGYLVSALCENDLAPELVHPAVRLLAARDAEDGSELLRTLECFLACGESKVRAAERLHAHVNTLKYRLSRIGELTALDLSDGDERLYLELSLRIWDNLALQTRS